MDLQETPATTGRPRGHRTGMERFLIGLTLALLLSSVVLVGSLVYVVTSGAEEKTAAGRSQVADANRSQGGMASPRTMGQATVPEQVGPASQRMP
ncbi:hypothetical protein FJT64_010898 [Amphibalanus amphitrite]|uniref:Uncharacterized protein n=1 Tax=Amphibalanus amphitrite TaxID=1232801 RepID=A0A6A4VKN2_AMPAM|nr:hypothetical protein FJT64_010898 [Amphibalanus amphitrite]